MLGLYGVYKRCHIQDAKRILMGMADWFGYEVLDKLNHENIQKCWYVNMDLLMNLI